MHDLCQAFDRVNERLDPSAAAGMEAVFQFYIPDAGDYHLKVTGGRCELCPGEHSNPSVSLSMDLDVLASILDGSFSGAQAFVFGKIRVEGNMRLATALSELFSSGVSR